MNNGIWVFLLVGSIGLAGCNEVIVYPDLTPPASPRSLITYTGDNRVDLYWHANSEEDLAGYNVYVSSSYNGKYVLIGTTHTPSYVDYGSRNGQTYYYAVSAFDYSENESELSPDVAYDTPRPEGYDVILRNYRTHPDQAGYDFSSGLVGPFDDKYTDVFFEFYNGTAYADVWNDSKIEDLGYTESLYDVGFAPAGGWSGTGDEVLQAGHTYVIQTWDDHYAKFRVTHLTTTGVRFDWAYQLQEGNTRLKPSVVRGKLSSGSGMMIRG